MSDIIESKGKDSAFYGHAAPTHLSMKPWRLYPERSAFTSIDAAALNQLRLRAGWAPALLISRGEVSTYLCPFSFTISSLLM